MNRIMVPLDGSRLAEGALPVASWLARQLKAEVTFLIVGGVPESAEQERELRAELAKSLVQAEQNFPAELPRRTRIELLGEPARGILQAAHEDGIDLIVMSTHGRSGLSTLVHGSVAADVVRAGEFPVTLVHPTRTE